jgi:ferritin-like metal-binding protein YciE
MATQSWVEPDVSPLSPFEIPLLESLRATKAGLLEELNDLLQLEHDAVAAFQGAIDRLEAVQLRNHFRVFKADHEAHTRNLSLLIRSLDGTPVGATEIAGGSSKDRLFFAALADDRDIFLIMRANEEFIAQKYERTLKKLRGQADSGHAVAQLLRGNLQQEQVHREWIASIVSNMD